MTLPHPDFSEHRERLLAALPSDEAVLVFGGPLRRRNGDADYRYRPDSDVWWLTGWPDTEVAVFIKPGDAPVTMFVQERDPTAETWTGRRAGPEGAVATFGADNAFTYGELEAELPRLLQGVRALHYDFGRSHEMDKLVQTAIYRAGRAARRNGLPVPETFHSLTKLVHELRLVKSANELDILRKAGEVTANAHMKAMKMGRPGAFEFELESAIENHFRAIGGTGPGYTSIIASGDNANILHYIVNDQQIDDGDLVLVDAGGEIAHYTADITRTWPANGRFTEAQKKVYQVVLDAQHAAIDACRAGRTFMDVHDAAVRVLTEGMVDLGLLQGDIDELIESEAYKRYYMHGTSHWLGLDVHDVGAYAAEGTSRILVPGMVLTVEPGLYIPAHDEDAPEALRGIGVRIEDDIAITDGDPENLTAAVPKSIDEIEALCQGASA